MEHLLADNSIPGLFGTVAPPVGGTSFSNPTQALSSIIVNGLKITILIAGFVTLFYLLWGAFDWLVSEGEAEKMAAARNKMTQAVVGLILVIGAFAIFSLVAGDILKIFKRDSNGNWIFTIPTFNGQESGSTNQNNFPTQRAAP